MKGNYKNILLIALFTVITVAFVFWQTANNMMMVNETFALILVIISILVKWFKADKIQYVIFFLFILPLFSLLNYSYAVTNGNETITYHSGRFNGLISPVVFLLFGVYFIINLSSVSKIFRHIFNGSDKEIENKNDKEADFYYQSFKSSTDEEFIRYYKMYNDYPFSAKTALDKIKEERNL